MLRPIAHAACFALVLAAWFVLRPLRDELGVLGGVDALPWLFTATLIATLVLLPLHGWLASRVARRHLVPLTWVAIAIGVLGCRGALGGEGGEPAARACFVFLSVVNLFLVAGFWAAMSDRHDDRAARRHYGLIAAGGTLGAVGGPLLVTLASGHLAPADLVYASAVLLGLAAGLLSWLAPQDRAPEPVPGGVWSGLARVAAEPRLRLLAALVVGHALVGTLIYLGQARLVAEHLADSAARVAFFARLDLSVNLLTLGLQVFATGWLLVRLGLLTCLVALPALLTAGFAGLALAPMLAVVAALTLLNRVLHHALMKPAREVLFTCLPVADRHRARAAMDTFIYRASDAVGGWLVAGLTALGGGLAGVAVSGVLLSAGWGFIAARTARTIRPEHEEARHATP